MTALRQFNSSLALLPLTAFVLPACMVAEPESDNVVEVREALVTAQHVPVVVTFKERHAESWSMPELLRGEEIAATRRRVLDGIGGSEFELDAAWSQVAGMSGTVSRLGLDRLVEHPDVASVALDVGGQADLEQSAVLIGARRIGKLDGDGITVAILDTGVDREHVALAGKVIDEHCFCAPDCCPNGKDEQDGEGAAKDDNGHGTYVAGIVAGNGQRDTPTGISTGVRIVAIKVADRNMRFERASLIVSALDWLAVKHPDLHLVNASLSSSRLYEGDCSTSRPELAGAVTAMNRRKTVLFASSGNGGDTKRMGAPACVDGVIAVGAVYDADVRENSYTQGSFTCTDANTSADKVACFSNSSSELDLLAPGSKITSTATGNAGRDGSEQGTSMAAPHAMAAAALLLGASNGRLDALQVVDLLMRNGSNVTDPRQKRDTPRVDVGLALKALAARRPR